MGPHEQPQLYRAETLAAFSHEFEPLPVTKLHHSAVDVEAPHSGYLDRLMRRQSFQALWPLFAKATQPAKEMTESFSALVHLRRFMNEEALRVIHVGDGAHARTAALFALKSSAENISVDPVLNEALVTEWIGDFSIRRLGLRPCAVQKVVSELNALPQMPTLVTFVHAHVSVDAVLQELKWDAAYSLACCSPRRQLSQAHRVVEEGEDWGVLSVMRTFQVLVNDAGCFA